jgi:hypothetical protein
MHGSTPLVKKKVCAGGFRLARLDKSISEDVTTTAKLSSACTTAVRPDAKSSILTVA